MPRNSWKGSLLLKIKSKSFFRSKYDILQDKKIGQLKIPFTQLLPSLRLGAISFNVGQEHFNIIVPLRGNKQIGFVASGYRLVKDDIDLASAEFPARGSLDQFQVHWNEKVITFSGNDGSNHIYIDGSLFGSIYYNFENKKVDAIDVDEKLPLEIQIFAYFAYKKYSELTLGI